MAGGEKRVPKGQHVQGQKAPRQTILRPHKHDASFMHTMLEAPEIHSYLATKGSPVSFADFTVTTLYWDPLSRGTPENFLTTRFRRSNEQNKRKRKKAVPCFCVVLLIYTTR